MCYVCPAYQPLSGVRTDLPSKRRSRRRQPSDPRYFCGAPGACFHPTALPNASPQRRSAYRCGPLPPDQDVFKHRSYRRSGLYTFCDFWLLPLRSSHVLLHFVWMLQGELRIAHIHVVV